MSGVRGTVVGVGVDAVEVERFRRVLDRRPHLAQRLFTPAELGYAGRAADPVPRLCTRFAAKEAVMKALGVGLGAFAFTEVEVVRVGLDAPTLVAARRRRPPGRPARRGPMASLPHPHRAGGPGPGRRRRGPGRWAGPTRAVRGPGDDAVASVPCNRC